MTGKDQDKNPDRDSRKRRLSAALRDNLKRRKAQAKQRASTETGRIAAPHDSAGIGADKRKQQP